MSAVTLSWDDPAKAAEFAQIYGDLRRRGYLFSFARDALVELVRDSEITGPLACGDTT